MAEVRVASQRDMDEVFSWLREERRLTGEGFDCNAEVIDRAFRDGQVVVAVEDGHPLAFLAGGLKTSGILEVRPDMRGRGLGRLLAQRGLRDAVEQDRCLLEIECAPISSVPFWQRMGFTLHSENRAHLELPKWLPLPAEGEPKSVEISFHRAEDRYRGDRSNPLAMLHRLGSLDRDGTIHLVARAIYNEYLVEERVEDPIVRVAVDKREIYFNKLKYEAAKALGVRRDGGYHFYLDTIRMPQPYPA